jgi:hypothetical protein
VSGTVDLELSLESETGRFADADGTARVSAKSIALGNGKSKIDVGGLPMSVEEIRVEEIAIDIKISKGIGEIEKTDLRSADFDAKVEGTINFLDPLSRSRLDLYLTFKFTDGYANKSETSKSLVSNMDAFSRDLKNAHRTDGYYGFRYRGAFGSARLIPSKRNINRKDGDQEGLLRPRPRRPRGGVGLQSNDGRPGAGALGERPNREDFPRGDPMGAGGSRGFSEDTREEIQPPDREKPSPLPPPFVPEANDRGSASLPGGRFQEQANRTVEEEELQEEEEPQEEEPQEEEQTTDGEEEGQAAEEEQ